MANTVEINVPVVLDMEDIAHAFSREQAEQMIVEIDSAQCDVGFSEDIIKRLCDILKPCYDSVDEYESFLESLK